MVVARTGGAAKGVLPSAIGRLRAPPSAIITHLPEALPPTDRPILKVNDPADAILDLGRFARDRLTAKVVAVTGSAGKTTTVSMLEDVLARYGSTSSSAHNANLSHGVAWNLASMPADGDYVVLETAIGRMARTARIARPDIALVTNILPAHLDERGSLSDIAETKSAIVTGMRAGGTVILNRQMAEWQVFAERARAGGLAVLNYGTSDDCRVRLLDYRALDGIVCAEVDGFRIDYRLAAPGRHMALNSLATLAALVALGEPLEAGLSAIAAFKPLPGRGARGIVELDGKAIDIIDDAYNANPGSMTAALTMLADTETRARRIAVLGEMAELGPRSADYHAALVPLLADASLSRVYLMGAGYADVWSALPARARGAWVDTLDALEAALRSELEHGDLVLLKGSHSTGLHRLVSRLRKSA